jgi:Holliday junction resolvase
MKRRLTRRENIGYQGEKKAVEILRKEGYIVESWLHSELKVGQEPYDIAARKGLARYLIDVKSSTSDKRKLPIHDHSLVDHCVKLKPFERSLTGEAPLGLQVVEVYKRRRVSY